MTNLLLKYKEKFVPTLYMFLLSVPEISGFMTTNYKSFSSLPLLYFLVIYCTFVKRPPFLLYFTEKVRSKCMCIILYDTFPHYSVFPRRSSKKILWAKWCKENFTLIARYHFSYFAAQTFLFMCYFRQFIFADEFKF